jgi:ribosomal protein L7/L12
VGVSLTETKLSPEISAAILVHLQRGEKIAAIKTLRDATGMELIYAKQMVEGMDRARPQSG